MTTRVLIALVLVGGVTAVWLLSREPSPTAKSPAVIPPVATAREAPPAPQPSAVADAEPKRVELTQPRASEVPDAKADGTEVAADDAGHDKIQVEGTISVLDPRGEEHRTESGTVSFVAWRDDMGSHVPSVTVDAGHFCISVARGTSLEVQHLELAGRAAQVPDDQRWPITTAPLEIHARWPQPTVLRVIDALSRADAILVQVVRAKGWETNDHDHPGAIDPGQVVRAQANSPFEIQPSGKLGTRWQETLYVRAEGYAWARFEVDFGVGGEQLVELHRSAELEVTLVNFHPDRGASEAELEAQVDAVMKRFLDAPADHFPEGKKPSVEEARRQARERLAQAPERDGRPRPMLRIREATDAALPDLETLLKQIAEAPESSFKGGKRPTEEELRGLFGKRLGRQSVSGKVKLELPPSRSGPTRITDLLPGKYVVAVEIGNSWDDPVVLGHEVIEIRPDERAAVTLTLTDPPTAGTAVPLEGTLHVPPAWTGLSPDLSFEILDRPDLDGNHRIRARFAEMQPIAGSPGLFHWRAGLVPPGRYVARIYDLEITQVIDVPPEGQLDTRIVIGEPADLRVHLVDAQTGGEATVNNVHWYCERPTEVTGGGLESAKYDAATQSYELRAPAGKVVVHVWERKYQFIEQTVELKPGANEVTIELELTCGILVSLRDGEATVSWPDDGYLSIEAIAGDAHGTSSGQEDKSAYAAVSMPGRYRVTVPEIDGYEPVPPFEIDIPPAVFVEHTVMLHRRR